MTFKEYLDSIDMTPYAFAKLYEDRFSHTFIYYLYKGKKCNRKNAVRLSEMTGSAVLPSEFLKGTGHAH